jgi:hypothetical protein
METRELYKQKFEAQIHEWSARLEALGAHADKLTAEAKLEAKPRLDALHGKLEDAKARLQEIAATADDRWDDVKKSADQAWNDVKAAIEGAYDALKPGDPGKKPS